MVNWVRLAAAGVLCAVGSGCGNDGPMLEGKVVNGSAPYTLVEKEAISINMVSEDGKNSASSNVDPDGTFKVKGSTGAGVVPGRYKVTYTHYNPPGVKASGPPATKKASETWEVGPTSKSFTLDIGTGKK